MPLIRGYSPQVIDENIKRLLRAGLTYAEALKVAKCLANKCLPTIRR